MSFKNRLWVEKYRPSKASDYVFVDSRQQKQVEGWIKEGSCPHVLFAGEPGTGKTTLAKVLINELGVQEFDVLEINASRDNGVDFIRERIEAFVMTMPFGAFKVVLLDEADYLSQPAQAVLRGLIEQYANVARFMLTCNYVHKVIPALKSRCETFIISKPERTEFTARAAMVLVTENIEFDLDTLDSYVGATYPDLRKCLNQLQNNSTTGKLLPTQAGVSDEDSTLVEATALFKAGKILDGRKILLQYLSMNPGQLDSIYTWCYNNLDLWGKTQEQKDQAIIIIRNGLANLSLVGIPEISLAATLIELSS
jgi:DNA polymerase III delta prime subunit